jgi:hypothetical protein
LLQPLRLQAIASAEAEQGRLNDARLALGMPVQGGGGGTRPRFLAELEAAIGGPSALRG